MKKSNGYEGNLLATAIGFACIGLLALGSIATVRIQASSVGAGDPKAVAQDPAYDLGKQRIELLSYLLNRLKLGDRFSVEEAQVLTHFGNGDRISVLEADAVISRVLYAVYVENNESSLREDQRDLLSAYQDFAASRGVAIADLKVQAQQAAAPGGGGVKQTAPPPSGGKKPAVAPPNDMCAGAEVIPAAGPFPVLTTPVDITDATETGDPAFTCQANSSRRIWYTITPSSTALYTITTCQNQAPGTTLPDTVLAVYTSTGGCGGTFTSIACNDDDAACSGGTFRSTVSLVLNSGTQYFILVGKFNATAPTVGAASVQLWINQQAIATNDTCAGAIALTLDTPVASSLAGLADDYELSGSACFTGIGQVSSTAVGRDAVYSFTAPTAGTYSFRAQSTAAGGNLVLYVASSCPAATPPTPVTVSTCLAAANRNTNTAAFTATEEVFCVSLTMGQQVFVFVDETTAGATGGAYTIEVNRCVREVEANGTPATANALACGIEGSITPAADADFYMLGTSGNGLRVFAAVFGLAANTTDTQLRVTTATDTLEFDDDDGDTTTLGSLAPVIAGTPLTAAQAFLRVNPFSASLQSEPYRLFSVVQPPLASATAETEPNDTIAQANTSTSNYFSGALAGPSPSTDVDVYVFSAAVGDLIFLALDGDPLRDNTPLNARLDLLDSTGAVIRSANDGNATSNTTSGAGSLTATTPNSPAEAIVFRVTTAGTYYARVLAGSTSATTAAGDYLLSITKNCQAGGGGLPCTITCPGNISVSNDPNQCGAVVNYSAPTTMGTCGTVTCAPPSGSFFPTGTTTVTCTTTAGPSCSFTITVNDTVPPTITCPANITQSNDPNQCGAVVNYPPPTVADNCPGVGTPIQTSGLPSGSLFPVGTTTNCFSVMDAAGNPASCCFTVTVNDTQPPSITCPPNVTAVTDQNPCPSPPCQTANFTVTATDNCPGVTFVCKDQNSMVVVSGNCFPIGITTVTCTATDTSGNTASCSFTITVFDTALEDDSNPAIILLWNSVTGQYRFCCNGVTFTGVGKASRQGCVYTLEHNPSDRRVLGRVDKAVHGGTGSIQAPPGTTRCTITDRNTLNDPLMPACQ